MLQLIASWVSSAWLQSPWGEALDPTVSLKHSCLPLQPRKVIPTIRTRVGDFAQPEMCCEQEARWRFWTFGPSERAQVVVTSPAVHPSIRKGPLRCNTKSHEGSPQGLSSFSPWRCKHVGSWSVFNSWGLGGRLAKIYSNKAHGYINRARRNSVLIRDHFLQKDQSSSRVPTLASLIKFVPKPIQN